MNISRYIRKQRKIARRGAAKSPNSGESPVLKGHLDSHLGKKVLKDCWEYEYKKLTSFEWTEG